MREGCLIEKRERRTKEKKISRRVEVEIEVEIEVEVVERVGFSRIKVEKSGDIRYDTVWYGKHTVWYNEYMHMYIQLSLLIYLIYSSMYTTVYSILIQSFWYDHYYYLLFNR